ncbi:MAG: SCO family protein [Leptospiraceae bacterium]|nr:SCO family protein [Leptospiraceae bacterium]
MKILLISFLVFLNCSENEGDKSVFTNGMKDIQKSEVKDFSAPKENLPYYTKKQFDPIWDEFHPEITSVTNFEFDNQYNKKFTEENLSGKTSIVCFFYTKCGGICPYVMRNMMRIKDKFKGNKKIQYVSISVTPETDTPKVLKEYSYKTKFGGEDWSLLTGKKEKVYSLARDVFLADTNTYEKRSNDEFIHSEQIYIIDSKRRIRGIYNGNINGDIERVIKDIQVLEKLN